MTDKPTIEDAKDQLQQTEKPNLDGTKAIIENAIKTAETGDEGILLEQMVLDALTEVRDIDKAQYVRYKAKIRPIFKKSNIATIQSLDDLTKPPSKQRNGGGEREASRGHKVATLIRLDAELFHDADGECWARCQIKNDADESDKGHYEVHNLNSQGFKDYAEYLYFKATESGIGDAAMKDVVNSLRPPAKFEGDEHQVHIRCAMHDNNVYIDMCNDSWQVIKIDASGWSIKESGDIPVMFTRSSHMRPLPEPEKGYSLDLLWSILPVKDEYTRRMLIVWMIDSMLVDTKYMMLELTGIAGSVKSGTQSVIRSLVDPSEGALLTYSGKLDDIPVLARHSHVVSYENMDMMSKQMSNKFCTMLTGGANATRSLHTTNDLALWTIKRPIMVNGIPDIVGRPDLLQRTISLEMPPISVYKSDKLLAEKWEKARPRVLGALYDLFSKVLNELKTSTLMESSETRQVDFLRTGQAIFDAMSINEQFIDSYEIMMGEHTQRSIDNSPVAQAIINKLKKENGFFETTVTGLIGELSNSLNGVKPEFVDSAKWPKDVYQMRNELKEITTPLNKKGVTIERRRSGPVRYISFSDIVDVEV